MQMPGVRIRMKDVVFVATANNPDQIDPALLRAGRFTENGELAPPASHQILRAIAQ